MADGPDGKPPGYRQKVLMYAGLFLVFGTCSVVFGKVLYQTKAVGRVGYPGAKSHNFEKPWMQNCLMFAGMMLCLVLYFITEAIKSGKRKEEPLLGGSSEEVVEKKDNRVYYVVIVPAVCDFAATFMMNVGLLFISASVWQMIRGSIVVFSVLIRMVWLKKKIRGFEWFGVCVIMVALAVVGLSSVMAGKAVHASPMLRVAGILLVFFAQAIQALQTVVEEHLLHDIKASSRQIVGLEGFWGFILCAGVAMPIAAYLPGKDGKGIHEDTIDSLHMLENSGTLVILSLIFVFVILGFNICGMRMTKYTNSVSRNVMEAVRTLCIWVTSLLLHIIVGGDYGEEWTNWSWLQLGGFFILVFGLFVYYEVLHLSWFAYEDREEFEEDKADEERKKHWAMTPAPAKTGPAVPPGSEVYMP